MAAFDQWRLKSAMAARWPGAVLLSPDLRRRQLVGLQADGRGCDAGRGGETREAEGTLCAERHRGEPKRQLRGDARRAAVSVRYEGGRGQRNAVHGLAELDDGGAEMRLATGKRIGPFEA